MSETKKSYQQIIKATSLFGSVQLFSILVSIIRNMFIANFIGPIGMGIAALLNSTLNKDYVDKWIIKMNNQLNFMSQTIDDFRNFYKPKEDFKEISLKKVILKAISLINLQLKINNIRI